MYVLRHALAGPQHLRGAQGTLHRECLANTHKVLHPCLREQVVSDGNLARGGKSHIQQQLTEKCRVEHDVTVIANEGIPVLDADAGSINVDAQAFIMNNVHEHRVAESPLEVEIGLAGPYLLTEYLKRDTGKEHRQHLLKLRILQHTVVDRWQLLRLKRPDRVKF